jgi:hypothetical protein
MKQSYTIENEIAMILDLLTDLVENGSLKINEADQIIKKYIEMQIRKADDSIPGKGVLNNIMSYSKALDVFKHPVIKPMTMIVN